MSAPNGLFTAGDVAGGFYGAKLEVDAHYVGSPACTTASSPTRAWRGCGRVRSSTPAQFYDDLDHYPAVGRQADNVVSDAARVQKASKIVPPKISGALALAGVGYDIANGKDPVQAVASGGGGFSPRWVPAPPRARSSAPSCRSPASAPPSARWSAPVSVCSPPAPSTRCSRTARTWASTAERGLKTVTDTGKAIGGGIKAVGKGIAGLFD